MKFILSILCLFLLSPLHSCSAVFEGGFGSIEMVKEVAIKGVEKKQGNAIVNVIKGAINRVLGLLGLIALIILIYGGFQMLTAAGDDKKYGAGYGYLKTAATALMYIGIAWFVVSIIFYVLGKMTN